MIVRHDHGHLARLSSPPSCGWRIVRTARRLRQEAAAEADGADPDLGLGAGDGRAARPADARASWPRSSGSSARPRPAPCAASTRAGLVDRAPDPADGRSSLVSVNAAGRERLRRLRGRKNAYLARRMRDLPEPTSRPWSGPRRSSRRMLGGRARLSAALRRSFDSLSVPNYRRYFAGQLVSLSGTWMQTVAAVWLILTLTDCGRRRRPDHGAAVPADAALRRLGRPARRPDPQAPAADRRPRR